jgi:hypothetical protein
MLKNLQPLVRYIFERIVMAVIVIIGVIVSVFTILYFSLNKMNIGKANITLIMMNL